MRIMIKGSLYSVEEIKLCDNEVKVILSKNRQVFLRFGTSEATDDFMQRMLVKGYAEIAENEVVCRLFRCS